MRIDLAPRRTAAERGVGITRLVARRRGVGVFAPALAVASVLALLGCSSDLNESLSAAGAKHRIPLPKAALLKPQPAPNCELRTASLDAGTARPQADAPFPSSDASAKLDYERQCYRHAEIIARSRLHDLQESVQDTAKAVKRSENSGP